MSLEHDDIATPTVMRYTVNLYVTVPMEDGETGVTNRELEQMILHALRRFDYDADCEVMSKEEVSE